MSTQATQTFELNLFDTTRTGQLATLLVLGILALTGLSVWAILAIDKGWLMALALLAVVGGGGYLGWRAYKQAAVVPAVVTISATELRVDDLRPVPRLSQTLRLADITTYLYSNYSNTEELRLNRAAAAPLRLRSTGALGSGSQLGAVLAAFEQVMEATPNLTGAATRRQRSFFEKSISTYLLIVFTLVLAALLLAVFAAEQPIRGNWFVFISSYVAYVVAWRAAAARRNAP